MPPFRAGDPGQLPADWSEQLERIDPATRRLCVAVRDTTRAAHAALDVIQRRPLTDAHTAGVCVELAGVLLEVNMTALELARRALHLDVWQPTIDQAVNVAPAPDPDTLGPVDEYGRGQDCPHFDEPPAICPVHGSPSYPTIR